MSGFAVFIFIVLLCALRRMSRRLAQTPSITLPVTIERDAQAEVRELQRTVDGALSVINKTKDIETGIKEFAVVKNNLKKLAGESPLSIRITMILGDKEIGRELEIGSPDTDKSFAELEKDWMRGFFIERTDTFIKQSEATSDPTLKAEFMRDALRATFKGLEYLPDDEELKTKTESTEKRLKELAV